MPTSVTVNKLTVVHAQSGGVAQAFPDVCLAPGPFSPIPIPFPNVATSQQTAMGSKTVQVDGLPIMLSDSFFATSSGDEGGPIGGVTSGVIKGKAYPKMYSFDVKVEGQNVFRFSDIMLLNGGSPTNTPPGSLMQANQPGAAKAAAKAKKPPEVISLSFSPATTFCGDEVALEVKGKELPGPSCPVTVSNGSAAATVSVPAQGSGGKKTLLTRRGPKAKQVKARASYRNPTGALVESGDLEVKAPADIARASVGPKNRKTPQWLADKAQKKMVKTGKDYQWQYFYEIELKEGVLRVVRRVEFDLQGGRGALTEREKEAWRQEIERVWSRRFELHRKGCKRGATCTCPADWGCCRIPLEIKVEFGPPPVAGVQKVKLHSGACDPKGWGKAQWWYSNNWYTSGVGVGANVRPHEFGHLIGMYDEYPNGACEASRKFQNEPTSVMSRGTGVELRHVQEFIDWLEQRLEAGFGATEPKKCS